MWSSVERVCACENVWVSYLCSLFAFCNLRSRYESFCNGPLLLLFAKSVIRPVDFVPSFVLWLLRSYDHFLVCLFYRNIHTTDRFCVRFSHCFLVSSLETGKRAQAQCARVVLHLLGFDVVCKHLCFYSHFFSLFQHYSRLCPTNVSVFQRRCISSPL